MYSSALAEALPAHSQGGNSIRLVRPAPESKNLSRAPLSRLENYDAKQRAAMGRWLASGLHSSASRLDAGAELDFALDFFA